VSDLTACPDKLVSSLIELLVTGMSRGYMEDAEKLLSALHVMRPRFRELHVYDVWLRMRQKRFQEATQMLRELEPQPLQAPFDGYVSALLAVCLFSVGDPSWRIFANQVIARNDNEDSVALVEVLLGKRTPEDVEAGQQQSTQTPAEAGAFPYAAAYSLRA
jgi:type III secretion protein HrpB1